jgi:heme-degrading monooxygenase HmoA
MMLEIAEFTVKPEESETFEATMRECISVIGSSHGYLGHTLHRSQESPGRYVMEVRWTTLEAHTQGFRGSPAFETWKSKLGHFRDGARVEHFETVFVNFPELEDDLHGV